MTDIPLNQRESATLEFKSVKALDDLRIVGRGVVAMLNAGRDATLWVGIGEVDGIASQIEHLPDPERDQRRVLDHLLDTIEPTPRDFIEVILEPVKAGHVMRIVIHAASATKHRPYAYTRKGTRLYVTRAQDRVRPLGHDELKELFRGETERDHDADVRAILIAYIDDVPATPGLDIVVAIAPRARLSLSTREVVKYFHDPSITSNRPSGWNFVNEYEPVKRVKGGIQHGGPDGYTTTFVRDTGLVHFHAPLDRLHWKGAATDIWPYALMEYPTLIVRLARALYAESGSPSDSSAVGAVLILNGIEGWKLKAGSPRDVRYSRTGKVWPQNESLVVDPVTSTWPALRDRTDRLASRLIVNVYQAFGFWEDEVPPELDRATGRLRFPD